MSTNFKIHLKSRCFGEVETAIGTVAVFYISVGDQDKLLKELNDNIEKIEPKRFVQAFCRFVCFPINSIEDDENKPDSVLFLDEDISKLTDGDLNAISDIYLENNDYLYRESITKRKNEDGKVVISREIGDVIHPKEIDETSLEYLHRLSIVEQDDRKKLAEQASKSILGASHFSSMLDNNILKTLSLGANLASKLEGIQTPSILNANNELLNVQLNDYKRSKLPEIDHDSINTARLEPFNKLGNKLDKLVEATIESGEFLVEMNKTQTQVANELKESGDTSSRFSKINIWISSFVILLTVIGLSLSVYAQYTEASDTKSEQKVLIETFETLNNNMIILSQSWKDSANSINQNNNVLLLKLLEELQLEKKLVDEQDKKIKELSNIVENQNNTIKKINEKLNEVWQ